MLSTIKHQVYVIQYLCEPTQAFTAVFVFVYSCLSQGRFYSFYWLKWAHVFLYYEDFGKDLNLAKTHLLLYGHPAHELKSWLLTKSRTQNTIMFSSAETQDWRTMKEILMTRPRSQQGAATTEMDSHHPQREMHCLQKPCDVDECCPPSVG